MERDDSRRFSAAAADALGTLLGAGSRRDSLRQALAIVARAVDLDRISLIEFETQAGGTRTVAHHRFDWRREAPDELFHEPDTVSFELDTGHRFWARPGQDDDLILTQTADAGDDVRARLAGWDVRTVLSVLIELPDGFTGALNFVHKRAAYVWSTAELAVVRALGRPLAAACLRYDTDTRLAADEHLSREAFDNSTVGMTILGADGTMLEVNDAFCTLFGYAREDLIGRNTLMFAHPDDVAIVHYMRAEGLMNREITDAERRFIRGDGEVIWTQCSLSLLRSREGETGPNTPTFAVQVRDITSVRQASVIVELERSNRELEQFAYIASHDLQEPLRMITSYLELLQRRYAGRLDEDADEFIGYAVDGAKRMRALVSSLLVYSRLDSASTTSRPVDLSATLEQALQPLRLLIDDTDARVTHAELPIVIGDAAQLAQLFQNLVENAIKFRAAAPPEIHVSAARERGFWRVSVRDNGIGFDPAQAERIFGVFRRLHRYGQYPGTGIGLAICKRIVERHGGTISAASTPGAGATFTFTLPATSG